MSLIDDAGVDAYTITFRREIIFYLRQLINDGDQISIMFNQGRETILTILLDVDEEKDLLYFDWGSSEETNKLLLQSERNYFVAMPQGVRNQFMTGKPVETLYQKRKAFAAKIPDKYVRMQRREFFRLSLPITQRPVCVIKSGTAENPVEMELSTVDIGLGGVGLEVPKVSFPCEVGMVFDNVRIDLKTFGELNIGLEIRYAGEITKGNKQLVRLGCHFTKLSSAQEHILQRFIGHIQREERAKLGR